MKHFAGFALCILLASCATAPVPPTKAPLALFNDPLFAAPSERITADDLFAMSDEMKRFIDTEVKPEEHLKGYRQALFDSLYIKGGVEPRLRLTYDSAATHNAADTFAAHSGNCLSLVIMTAAFAKAMDVSVRYQSVYLDDALGRSGDIYLFVGHVNLILGKRPLDVGFGRFGGDDKIIDFLPPIEMRGVQTREISESTILAMYMNNRAAEALVRGRLDDAYAWAKAAIAKDSEFPNSYNTLGIIYQRHGNLADAERAFLFALDRHPDNVHAMSNLTRVLNDEGRVAEAQEWKRKMDRIEPNPAFAFYHRGIKAMQDGDFKLARDMFAKEVGRAPYYHEFRYWLAAAYVNLGETAEARKQLALAIEFSTTRNDFDLYSAKLAKISSSRAN
ncbi:MAG TPA: tetratricopeptide repeat protein [Casimicrobiaceae bacterium]|nr:tetratricopeptide repeat protein [Casimicrobiaceae bacterium]